MCAGHTDSQHKIKCEIKIVTLKTMSSQGQRSANALCCLASASSRHLAAEGMWIAQLLVGGGEGCARSIEGEEGRFPRSVGRKTEASE